YELDAAAIERDHRAPARRRRTAAGETPEARRGLLDIAHRDDDAREATRAVAMRKPARLPDHALRVMGQNLDAAFRHGSALDTRDREGRGRRPGLSLDRP